LSNEGVRRKGEVERVRESEKVKLEVAKKNTIITSKPDTRRYRY